ncbi:MAG: hypothetical protein AAFR58_01435 [Cyanobacteria bacterium J06627_28]
MKNDFPASLWSNDRFEVPELLVDALWAALNKHDLLKMAQLEEVPKVCGGASEKDTNEYFAKLCAVSSVRPMSVLLDPHKSHILPNQILRECVHQGKLALIDFPCGCGTTTLGLLSVVEQMRRDGHWIAFDLEIEVLALDISPYALQRFQELIDTCTRKFNKQLIKIRLTTEVVDVGEKNSVSTVINDWVSSVENDVDYILVMASAFSGYASQSNNKEVVADSFDFIKNRLCTRRDQSRFLVWLEINSNSAKKFFKYLSKALKFHSPTNSSDYKFMNPFQKAERRCNLQSGCVEISRPSRTK